MNAGSFPLHCSDEGRRCTPLECAIRRSRNDVVGVLLNAGADCNLYFSSKSTALHEAVARKNSDIVHTLLDAGCSVNATDLFGSTALHIAMK